VLSVQRSEFDPVQGTIPHASSEKKKVPLCDAKYLGVMEEALP